MTTFLASLARLLAHALGIAVLALGQANAVELALTGAAACECRACCAHDEGGGACCARAPRAPAGPVWKERAGRCGCGALPSDRSPGPVTIALAPRSEARGKGAHVRAPSAPLALVLAFPREGALDPPPRDGVRPDPRAGRNGPFLGRSGGERSALLGCARL